MEYEKIGPKAYLMFNKADEKFVKQMSAQKGWLPKVYAGVFKLKKHVAPSMIPSEPKTPPPKRKQTGPPTPAKSVKKPHIDITQVPNVDSTNNSGAGGMASSSKRRKPSRKGGKRKRKGVKKSKTNRSKRTTVRKRNSKRKGSRQGGGGKFMKLYRNAKQNGVVSIKGYDTGFYAWMSTAGTEAEWGNKTLGASVGVCGVYSQKFLFDTEIESFLNVGASDTATGKSGVFQNPPQKVIAGGVVIGHAYQRNNDQEVFLIKDYVVSYAFTNTTYADIDMWIFEYKCIRGCNVELPTQLYDDYKQQQVFSDANAPFTAPGLATFWVDAMIMGAFGKSTRNWKMISRKHYLMKKDDGPIHHTVNVKNIIWDRQKFNNDNDAATGANIFHKNVSHDIVVIVRGALGNNSGTYNCGYEATTGAAWKGRKTILGVRANIQGKNAERQTIRDTVSQTAISGTVANNFTTCNPGGDTSFVEYQLNQTNM